MRQQLSQVPYDIYGLQDGAKKTQMIHLPNLAPYHVNPGLDTPYTSGGYVLQELWSRELLMPHLACIDKKFSSSRRSVDEAKIIDRSIVRGAILHCIAEAYGTDAVFASLSLEPFLATPTIIFADHLRKDEKFSKQVLKATQKTLTPLFDLIKTRVKGNTQLAIDARELGQKVQHRLLELHHGRSLSPDELLNLGKVDEGDIAEKDAPKKKPQAPAQKPKRAFSQVSLEVLLPNDTSPKFGMLGLILREALNERRNLGAGHDILRRVLEGWHASQNSKREHNRDQTDPVRQYSCTALLMQEHLPGSKLTAPEGLSNLLSWMGTGQGHGTKKFLDIVSASGGFFQNDLDAMLALFRPVHKDNIVDISLHGPASGSDKRGKVPIYDDTIWGQPSNYLNITPTNAHGITYTLEDKFGPYFAEEVQTTWVAWLGDLVNKDPATHQGDRKSWTSAMDMMTALNLLGFKTGLTVFQLVNSLVFLGLAKMPASVEVADWIYDHGTLGAYRGLQHLGFICPDLASVRSAYMIIYNHLHQFLTEDDKKILGFSPIFVEHLLCKVVQWESRLVEGKVSSLDKMATSIDLPEEHWISGKNKTDQLAFPFPFSSDPEELKKTIATIMVCI